MRLACVTQNRVVAAGAAPCRRPSPGPLASGKPVVGRCNRGNAPERSSTIVRADGTPFRAWESGTATVAKRDDLKRIMIIGAGPIVIGQACEFDYSGTQACKALRAEGYEVILINSNPATIMTDPETADRTYVGPMTFEALTDIVERERPDAILPTMGGQTGLNLAKGLAEMGVLDRLGIELIGAKLDSINVAEDRLLFKQAMEKIGLKCPPSGTANTLDEAIEIQKNLIGEFPVIIRPAFTLGGTGGGIAYNVDDFHRIVKAGLSASLTNQVLVEKSLLGWKEYELEVMRDLGDNQVIICSIENVDPMGVHTGDSITIAPSQTLTDKEYQRLRDASLAIMRIVGVECGGSNVQFGINPVDGEVMVIEMNPRVSRSSALASKATGFPIAKFAAKLACGTSLDRIPNDITKATPASFEPSIDYIVTKIPRFTFEKFPGAEPVLTTQMKSVGEAMAFGRTFIESFQKAMRSTELGYDGMSVPKKFTLPTDEETIAYNLRTPNPDRMIYIAKALELGWTEKKIVDLTKMDPWFVNQFAEVAKVEKWLRSCKLEELTAEDFREVKSRGCSDEQIAKCLGVDAWAVRKARKDLGVVPVYKRVDTCAAEFEANTPYQYSTYHEGECEANPTEARKVMILGGGPNRIGQGIEFDYCCCHAAFALRKAGFETIMVNCNPETVSTDYDTSDRLYFEPMTAEDVLNIIEKERPEGIVVQFGGQTPLKLCTEIQKYLDANPIPNAAGTGDVKIWGTQPSSIDEAEDRDLWYQLLTRLEIRQPPGSTAASEEEAVKKANEVGYPVMVRPSYVLGGRGMVTVFSDDELKKYVRTSALVEPDKPLLVDKYLDRATELDVDALCDKDGNVTICGIMEHIEMAGVHSGDSACSIPTQTVSEEALSQMREWTVKLAKALKVVGLINIQYVVQDGVPYIIEANPRASRTVPFVAKAIGHPIAKYASLLMAGKTLEDLGFTEEPVPPHVSVKEVVLPFEKFAGADVLLGPEMRSTGEVMGIDPEFSIAYLKASLAAGQRLPLEGNVFMSVNDESKEFLVPVARVLSEMGYNIVATSGTAERFEAEGIPVKKVLKVHEGRPNIMDAITNEEINLAIIMSTGDKYDLEDGKAIRRLALGFKVPIVTTVAGAVATAGALKALKSGKVEHKALQDYNPSLAPDFV